MTAAAVLEELRASGLALAPTVDGTGFIVTGPRTARTPALRARVVAHKAELLTLLATSHGTQSPAALPPASLGACAGVHHGVPDDAHGLDTPPAVESSTDLSSPVPGHVCARLGVPVEGHDRRDNGAVRPDTATAPSTPTEEHDLDVVALVRDRMAFTATVGALAADPDLAEALAERRAIVEVDGLAFEPTVHVPAHVEVATVPARPASPPSPPPDPLPPDVTPGGRLWFLEAGLSVATIRSIRAQLVAGAVRVAAVVVDHLVIETHAGAYHVPRPSCSTHAPTVQLTCTRCATFTPHPSPEVSR